MECLIAEGRRHKWWGFLKESQYTMKVSWKNCGRSRVLEYTVDGRGGGECSGGDRTDGIAFLICLSDQQAET